MALINNLYSSFLGHSPEWYKKTIIGFLIVNPPPLLLKIKILLVFSLIEIKYGKILLEEE